MFSISSPLDNATRDRQMAQFHIAPFTKFLTGYPSRELRQFSLPLMRISMRPSSL
jgi:hypothetical protein